MKTLVLSAFFALYATSSYSQIINGAEVPTGELEAVGIVNGRGFCTGTLIADDLVLTAGHCICDDVNITNCTTTATFTLKNVQPVDNPNTPTDESLQRRDIIITGTTEAHPLYGMDKNGERHWLWNDFAIIRLSQPVSSVAKVKPIPVEHSSIRPNLKDVITIVGFGKTGNNCATTIDGLKRKANVKVSKLTGETIVFENTDFVSCPGDSGGPAINANGNIVGVASTGNSSSKSNYDPTYLAYSWLYNTDKVLQTTGGITFLRVHDVNTGYGPGTDPIDGEVIIQLSSKPGFAFGFQLRVDASAVTHQSMLDVIRDCFNNNKNLRIDYEMTGPRNGKIIRTTKID